MTEAEDQTPAPGRRRPSWRPLTAPGWIILASLIAVLLVGGTAMVLRFGLNTAPGLMFVEARAPGDFEAIAWLLEVNFFFTIGTSYSHGRIRGAIIGFQGGLFVIRGIGL